MKIILLYLYAWLLALFWGAILSETIMLYPNIFYNVPDSLPAAMMFLKKVGPGDFFPKLGGVVLLVSITTILVNFSNKFVFKRLLLSFILLFVFEFLFSIFYFWPRNQIMFSEGSIIHSKDILSKTAHEFLIGHFVRLLIALITSLLVLKTLYDINHSYSKY